MAQWARRRLEALFTDVHAMTLDVLSEVRDELRAVRGTSELPGWDEVIGDDLFDLVAADRIDEARARVRAAVGLEGAPS